MPPASTLGERHRGLSSAPVLALMEATVDQRMCDRFDLVASCSPGGILVPGIGAGFSSNWMVDRCVKEASAAARTMEFAPTSARSLRQVRFARRSAHVRLWELSRRTESTASFVEAKSARRLNASPSSWQIADRVQCWLAFRFPGPSFGHRGGDSARKCAHKRCASPERLNWFRPRN